MYPEAKTEPGPSVFKEQKMTARTTVQIEVLVGEGARGNIHVSFSPSTAYAQPGDSIVWNSPGPFTVHFPNGSPVGTSSLYSDGSRQIVSSPVSSGARGSYKYSAAVNVNGRIYVGHSDSIIIEDPW